MSGILLVLKTTDRFYLGKGISLATELSLVKVRRS